MTKEEILSKIETQKAFVETHKMHDPKERVKALKLLHANIKEMAPEICQALKADLNKSEMESYMCEVGLTLSELSYMIKHCKRFSRNKHKLTPLSQFHSKSYQIPSPYGRVLIISPWNYPFMLAIEPLVDAVCAGNSVMLRPSSVSTNVSKVIEKLISKTFEEGHVTTVLCNHEECDFLLEQKFDYIFFTGSVNVGKKVMEKASKNLTPVTLELGGKSPCIVDETANIKLSAKRIVFGKFVNAGQTCVAPDYIYCSSKIKDELILELERQIVLQYSTDPLSNPDYPKFINEKQFNHALNFITEENHIFGGKYDEKTLRIEPTIISATFDSPVMQEEIFGPVLPIVTFESLEEAYQNVANRPCPLALYMFSKSKDNQNFIMSHLSFGGGCVNDTIIHLATSYMPFGGVGNSGMGSYHGKKGFDTFTHYKSIVDKKTWLDLPIRYAPYSKLKYALLKIFLK